MAEENGDKKAPGCSTVSARTPKTSKKLIKEKGKEELEGLKEPEKTQLYPLHFPRQAR